MKAKLTGLMLSLVVVLALTAAPTTAQGTGWHVESMQPLSKLLDGITPPQKAFPAPDGVQVAYEKKLSGDNPLAICGRNLASNEERCVELPKMEGYSFPWDEYYPPLSWSPDSTRLALVGEPYKFLRDSDLGLADLAANQYTVLAEDNYTGTFGFKPVPAGMSIEIQPAWSPDGTQIAVEREVANAEGNLGQATISIFTLNSDKVRDLTLLPGHEEYTRDMGSTIGLAWSPDGKTLAVSIRHPKLEPQYDGLWLLDVASGSLTRLVSTDQALQAFRQFYPGQSEILAVAPLIWSPDSSRILFWTGNPGAFAGSEWAFWVETATGKITPVPLPADPQDAANLHLIWPADAAWSPDGSQLLVVARHTNTPDMTGLTPLYPASGDEAWCSFRLIDTATGQDTLLGYAAVQIGVPYQGIWNADGSVLAGGYSFKLAH